MNTLLRYWLLFGAFALANGVCSLGQERVLTPSDCVQVRYVTGVWMSSTAKQVAYVVKASDIASNTNNDRVYITDIVKSKQSTRKVVFEGKDVTDVRWFDQDRSVALLTKEKGRRWLVFVDLHTGVTRRIVTKGEPDAYTIDAGGRSLAYISKARRPPVSVPSTSEQTRDEQGYRLSDTPNTVATYTQSRLYMIRKSRAGEWSNTQLMRVENPFTHKLAVDLTLPGHLSLSPDSRRLLLTFVSDSVPESWKTDPLVQAYALKTILVLYDIKTHTSRLALNSISPSSTPLWSPDSQRFFVNAGSPVGSSWQKSDVLRHRLSPADANLFSVDVHSGAVREVVEDVPDHHEGPLRIANNGDLIVRKSVDQIGRFRHIADSWHEISQIALPTTPNDRFSFLVSDGVVVVGVHETVTTPEELFRFVPNDGNIHLLTDLNPQLSHATFAPVRRVEWSTNGGLNITGLLFTPPDYIPGKRYPLVIQTKGDQGWFTCDSGANHDPSFAPQPLAEAGIMYLIRTVAPGFNWQDEIDARPGGYPGEISEAVQEMDIWDSAVRRLNRDGLIDPTKVGIIGFSRTGWEVEFDLFRSATRYAAATAADNVQYSLSEYWLHPQFARSAERMYGGPPYGSTLANWQEYSISFNLDRIHTPLLLEEMGYGSHEDDPKLIPQSLAVRYELSRGLARLGKPVEIYYYPDEVHQPDHPVARLASLERNVDWYRFWLQGYEDRDPCKREQYERWRSLRVLHEQDVARATASVNRQTSPEVKGGLAVSNK